MITIVDVFSRNTVFIDTSCTRGKTIVKIFQEFWMAKFSNPTAIITDQGRQFLSDAYIKFCDENRIRRITTTAYNPSGNSIAERVHRTLGNVLRIHRHDLKVKDILEIAMRNVNHGYHSEVKCCPVEMTNTRHLLNLTNEEILINEDECYNIQKDSKVRSLEKRNQKRNQNTKIAKNDKVMLKCAIRRGKLDRIWEGPFKVVEIKKNEDVLVIEKDAGVLEAVNIKRLRKI